MVLPIIVRKKEMRRELEKISEKELTVKDFQQPTVHQNETLCYSLNLSFVKVSLKFDVNMGKFENMANKKALGRLGLFYCFYEV